MRRCLPCLIGLLGVAAAALPGRAQTLPEALRLLPDRAGSLEVYPDLAAGDVRMQRLVTRVTAVSGSSFWEDLDRLGIPRRDLAPGPVLVGAFDDAAKAPDGRVYVLPVRPFQTLARDLKAVRAGAVYRGRAGGYPVYLANRGPFALVTRSKDLLAPFPAAEGLDRELAAQVPWLAAQTTSLVVPRKALRDGLATLGTGKSLVQGPLGGLLKPALDALTRSGDGLLVGLNLPADGSVQLRARLELRPGSPLAVASPAPVAPGGHPMAGLVADSFVLGAGGPLPQGSLEWLVNRMAGATLQAGQPQAPASGAAADWLAIQRRLAASVRSEAFTLALPTRPGDPLLGQMRVLLRVADARAYLDLTEQAATHPGRAAAGTWVRTVVHRTERDGRPLLTQITTLDLDHLPGQAPRQSVPVTAFMDLLFGSPNRITITSGMVDPTTVLTVMGDPDRFGKTLEAGGTPFPEDPGVVQADRMLPPGAQWRLYLDLRSLTGLLRAFTTAVLPGRAQSALPQVPAAPPLALGIAHSATALEMTGAATPEALDALGVLYRGFLTFKGKPRPKAGTPPPPPAGD